MSAIPFTDIPEGEPVRIEHLISGTQYLMQNLGSCDLEFCDGVPGEIDKLSWFILAPRATMTIFYAIGRPLWVRTTKKTAGKLGFRTV